MSILFDVGGVLGGIVAGALSDYSGAAALVSSRSVVCQAHIYQLVHLFSTSQ